jgi:hypothetical protein
MGHSINAVVGPAEPVAKIVEAAGCPPATELPFGLVIAPLGHLQIDRLTGGDLGEVGEGFNYLSSALEHGLFGAAGGGTFAYIETEYFGGMGSQAAAIFSDAPTAAWLTETAAEASMPARRESPINSALRSLGVKAAPGKDEFDTLGLGRFRDLESLGLDE